MSTEIKLQPCYVDGVYCDLTGRGSRCYLCAPAMFPAARSASMGLPSLETVLAQQANVRAGNTLDVKRRH